MNELMNPHFPALEVQDVVGDAVSGAARPIPRLQTLARHGRQAEERARGLGMDQWSDDLSHLASPRRAAWRRVLSSVATTEGLEQSMMRPLCEGKGADREAKEYLEVHAEDERRHHELLASYLKNTFGFVKKEPTWSDRVFYETLFPKVAGLFRRKPLYGFALLYCYERFAAQLYTQLRAQAQADGAQNLLSLIQTIEKDELRHVAAMEFLLKQEIVQQGGLKKGDLLGVGAMLSLVVMDVDMRPWAVHNREIREHLKVLGLEPTRVTETARRMRQATLELMRAIDQGASHVPSDA